MKRARLPERKSASLRSEASNPRRAGYAAAAYAASVAEAFGAHIAGVALTHDIIVPPDLVGAMPLGFIDDQQTLMSDQAAVAVAHAQGELKLPATINNSFQGNAQAFRD